MNEFAQLELSTYKNLLLENKKLADLVGELQKENGELKIWRKSLEDYIMEKSINKYCVEQYPDGCLNPKNSAFAFQNTDDLQYYGIDLNKQINYIKDYMSRKKEKEND